MPHTRWRRMALVASAVGLAGFFYGTAAVQAGEATGQNTGRISLNAGVDFPTAYFFRGILQEDEDFIAQPFGEITVNLYEGTGGLTSVSATLGLWNSLHSGPTGGGGPTDNPKIWYEADAYGGLTFGLFENWEAGVTYIAYTSPNDSFDTVQEVYLSLGYDDSDLLGPFALSPHVLVAFEFDNQADGGSDEGIYVELGVEPGLTLIKSEQFPVTLSFPITLGLSADDYYEFGTGDDSTFGYFDGGIVLSMPLGFIPAAFGTWEINAGVHFLALGDNLETVNSGDAFEAIGTFGISLAY
ncbi:MAG: hypothetical protein ACE5IQ_01075 [Candidatus Methylomirabilales bacterium]